MELNRVLQVTGVSIIIFGLVTTLYIGKFNTIQDISGYILRATQQKSSVWKSYTVPKPKAGATKNNDNNITVTSGTYTSRKKEPCIFGKKGCHKLCVLIPFRNRFNDLLEFVPHIHSFLNAQKINHNIVVINQRDNYRFNRAALMNVGFLQMEKECDYIAVHDIDLLPVNPALPYKYPGNAIFHVSAPGLHPKYGYATFLGGVLLAGTQVFRKLNGMVSDFWGWGVEDDEFYRRIISKKVQINRPTGIKTGLRSFKHLSDNIPRDQARSKEQSQYNV